MALRGAGQFHTDAGTRSITGKGPSCPAIINNTCMKLLAEIYQLFLEGSMEQILHNPIHRRRRRLSEESKKYRSILYIHIYFMAYCLKHRVTQTSPAGLK